jgi:hypothetical protein
LRGRQHLHVEPTDRQKTESVFLMQHHLGHRFSKNVRMALGLERTYF